VIYKQVAIGLMSCAQKLNEQKDTFRVQNVRMDFTVW